MRGAERRGNRLAYFIPKSSIIFLLSSTIFASKPSNHLQPLTQHHSQSAFRQNHDLSIFQESWPVMQISNPNKNNVQLSAISAFRLWNNDPIQSFSLNAAGQWETLSINEKVKFDTYYLENKSFWLNINILFMTGVQVIFHKGISH